MNIFENKFNLLFTTIKRPLLFCLLTITFLYSWDLFYWQFLSSKYPVLDQVQSFLLLYSQHTILFLTLYWIIYNLLNSLGFLFLQNAKIKKQHLLVFILPPVLSSLKGLLFITMLNLLILPVANQGLIGKTLEKSVQIFLILVIANIIYKIISSVEQFIINKYIDNNPDINDSRKINTQLTILKRVLVSFLVIFTLIAICMLFDSIKGLGITLLTTAGVLSAAGVFASQQSFSRLFAGLQLAFTQPMRIGDTVVINDEFGQVEEITLSFITIKLWDLRRLILPTDYFTDKGLLNLSRGSTALLGTIFLYADYTLPIDVVRKKFIELLNESPLWDKNVSVLEVTDIKEKTMEVRCLVSATDSSSLWKLRCELREKLIHYIVNNHYGCLTQTRGLNRVINNAPVNHFG